jgi:hypothetical protein
MALDLPFASLDHGFSSLRNPDKQGMDVLPAPYIGIAVLSFLPDLWFPYCSAVAEINFGYLLKTARRHQR